MGLPDLEDEGESGHGINAPNLIACCVQGEESSSSGLSAHEEEAEYTDEDQHATVTITEDFDPTAALRPALSAREPQDSPKDTLSHSNPIMPASSHRAQGKAKREKDKQKAEKEKSRSMETKAERKIGREMEARRRNKKAAIAIERDGKQRGRTSTRGRGGSRGTGKRGGKR